MRRALLLALLCALLVLPTRGAATASTSVDPRLSHATCDLTGRVWTADGCARRECVAGARLAKTGFDAELCARRGAPYAQPITAQRCGALGRVWIGAINACASQADRARRVVADAPQCATRGSTYLTHSEAEGAYDECVRPGRLRALERIARRAHRSLDAVALERNRTDCASRGGYVMSGGVCTARVGPPPAADLGGLDLIGDSVSFRAEDELAALRPDWTLDSLPGRNLGELAERLDHFRADHGDPTELVVQLGTNRRRGLTEADFDAVVATVPASVPVMFLLPYRQPQPGNAGPVAGTKKYAGWMRDLAATRPRTCVVDWPAYAAAHLDRLVDGEHPASDSERWYARYVTRSWESCAPSFT